jgi:hypothetical protein
MTRAPRRATAAITGSDSKPMGSWQDGMCHTCVLGLKSGSRSSKTHACRCSLRASADVISGGSEQHHFATAMFIVIQFVVGLKCHTRHFMQQSTYDPAPSFLELIMTLALIPLPFISLGLLLDSRFAMTPLTVVVW